MDIFSHGFWGVAAAQGIKVFVKRDIKFKKWSAAFWGVFPDLFAFAIPFGWTLFGFLTGEISREDLPDPKNAEPGGRMDLPIFRLSAYLYNYSHSLVIFVLVILGVVLFRKLRNLKLGKSWREIFPWSMIGWFVHVVMDIPTHSYEFYPTPFLWPISEWKFDGIRWGQWWFIILNYGLLVLTFFVLFFLRKLREKRKLG